MTSNGSLIAVYRRLIAAAIKQILSHKLQIQNSQVWTVFGAEIYIFWQPIAARISISLWQFYRTLLADISS